MRFRDVRDDGWYIGRDRWDAIALQPRRDVKIFGNGIFEPYPQSQRHFIYGYKYILQEAGNQNELFTSPTYEEHVDCPPADQIENHIIKHRFTNFPQGILVRAGQRIVMATWICYDDGHNRCFYSETGERPQDVEN